MIMGWGTDDVFVTALDNQQMAILDAGDKLHALAALPFVDGLGQCLVQVFYQHIGILRFQISSVMGNDLAISQCDDITADGEVIICHLIADAGSFQRSASFINFIQIIT